LRLKSNRWPTKDQSCRNWPVSDRLCQYADESP
jgi:hypothetical protein